MPLCTQFVLGETHSLFRRSPSAARFGHSGLAFSAFLEDPMIRRSRFMFLGTSALTGVFAMWSSLAGCQGNGTSTTTEPSGGGGSGGGGTGSSVASTTAGSTTGSSAASGTSATSSGAGGNGIVAKDITIKALNEGLSSGDISYGFAYKVTGVVAMSRKLLISKS